MIETLRFNDFNFQDDNARITLVRLIYMVNQGIYFDEQEREQLFFRTTKLFQSKNFKVRDMTYRLLKMITPQKYMHILLQSLSKDLIGDNIQIRVAALKFIPYIQNEQYVQQIERHIHNALMDSNLLVSSTALIVGINIINRFPYMIQQWLFEVVQKLDELRENLSYHALILLHELKKQNLGQFTIILIIFSKKQLQPMFRTQITKFIKEILPQVDKSLQKELLSYLFLQVQLNDPLTFFESSKIIVSQLEIQEGQLRYINELMANYINNGENSILLLSYLKYIDHLTNYRFKESHIPTEQALQIYQLTYDNRTTISYQACLLSIRFNYSDTVYKLLRFFNYLDDDQKSNFLSGLREIVTFTTNNDSIIFEFLRTLNFSEDQGELIQIAVHIVEMIIKNRSQNFENTKKLLIQLTENGSLESKHYAIKLMNQAFFGIVNTDLNMEQAISWIRYLEKIDLNILDYPNLKIVQKCYIDLINSYSYQEYYSEDQQTQSLCGQVKQTTQYEYFQK